MFNIFFGHFQGTFKQFKPDDGLYKLIIIHTISYFIVLLLHAVCYLSGYKSFISILDQVLTLPSSYTLLLRCPWTLFTHSFVHTETYGFFLDMLMLYIFGKHLQFVMRTKHIWCLYGLAQVGGAFAFLLLHQFSPPFQNKIAHLMGPSVAIYAMMIAVAVLMPRLKINLFFTTVAFRYIVIVLLCVAFMCLTNSQAAYYLPKLSGAFIGYVYAKMYSHNNVI